MKKIKIVAHTLVRNEARWIWYALNSILDHVDEVLVWDTGSVDSTPEIINLIASPKIKFKQIGPVDAIGHTAARQAMLDATDSDWILILDGDEIWYRESLASLIDGSINRPSCVATITPFINLVGDVYHYQDPARSRYQIGRHMGPYNIRFINRKIPSLHVANPHGRQEYRNGQDVALQNFPSDQLILVDKPYLHTTHLPRSENRSEDKRTLKRGFKYRIELGNPFPSDFIYPEVFYSPRPGLVTNPWINRTMGYTLHGIALEPLRLANQLIAKSGRSGY